MNEKPWGKYAVDHKEKDVPRRYGCQRLVQICHITHLPTALRIAEDLRIRADLVTDKSCMQTKRAKVVWASPNDWTNAGGFRYGNIRFKLDWNVVLTDARAYWVETMTEYSPHACRILLTTQEHPDLLEYYPENGDGPWWKDDSGNHYWNGKICLEFLLERDVELNSGVIADLDFVDHHPKRCAVDPRRCPYLSYDADMAGPKFVAGLVSRRMKVTDTSSGPLFLMGKLLINTLSTGFNQDDAGPVALDSPVASSLAMAALRAYEAGEDWLTLTQLFESKSALMTTLSHIVGTTLTQKDCTRLLR